MRNGDITQRMEIKGTGENKQGHGTKTITRVWPRSKNGK